MQYQTAAQASHPPANFDLMAVRLLEGLTATALLFALGALVVWLVVRHSAAEPDPQDTATDARATQPDLLDGR